MELVEMKNISKIKNTLEEIYNRLDSAEEENGELENMAIDAIQSEQHIEKQKTETSEQSLSECGTISNCLAYINWSY